MKSILLSAVLFFAFAPAHALTRLDHEYGSIYVSESALCVDGDFVRLKQKTYTGCKEDVFSRKTGRCTQQYTVVPRRPIVTTERVCVESHPGKNAPCREFADRQITLPLTYSVIEQTGSPKGPSRAIVHQYQIPACQN